MLRRWTWPVFGAAALLFVAALAERRPGAAEGAEETPRRLDASYHNLERLITWVGNADNKALIALTFQGVLIAGVAAGGGAIFGAIGKHPVAWWTYLVLGLIVCLALSAIVFTVLVCRVLLPDITAREKEEGTASPFFFGTIQAMSLEVFAARMRRLDASTIETELIKQIHVNAGIVARKFTRLKRAFKVLVAEVVILMVLFAVVGLITFATQPATGAAILPPSPAATVAVVPTGSSPRRRRPRPASRRAPRRARRQQRPVTR